MNEDGPQSKTGGNAILYIVIVLVVLAGAGYFFLKTDKNQPPARPESTMVQNETGSGNPTSVQNATATPNNTVMREGKIVTVTMEAGAFYFKPDKLTVRKGDRVKINLRSKDMMHNFYLDEFKVKGPTTKGGESSTVEFTADKAGTFEYYCAIGQHRKNGQVGSLTVE